MQRATPRAATPTPTPNPQTPQTPNPKAPKPRHVQDEHSLELHTPYIVHTMRGRDFKLVPIMVGALTTDA